MTEFVKGSIIVCHACGHPIYKLERGLGAMDRAGRGANAFVPLTRADLQGLLVTRPDIPVGWQHQMSLWLLSGHAQRVLDAAPVRAGDEAVCPHCGGQWCQFVARDGAGGFERGYQILLNDIPPSPGITQAISGTWAREVLREPDHRA